jgi:hypothetical protein
MVAPGTQVFTYVNFGKETTRGTPVAPTRQFYADGTGVLTVDPNLNFHESENTGSRGRIRRATQQSLDVALKIATSTGVSYDDMVLPLTQLLGGMTGAGGAADKTWTCTPLMTAANNPESFSFDVGDDTQNFRVEYGMMKSWKLSAARGDVTAFEAELFGQDVAKVAKAAPAANVGIKIPGDLWTVKFAATKAGLPGASVVSNFLLDWELEVQTGLKWRHYMDGNLFGSQHVETDIGGTLSMTVESLALAVSEFYDKWMAQTQSFVRLKAQGPVLGGSFYSLQFDLPVIYSNVEVISEEEDGVNMYRIEANLSNDPVSTFANIYAILVCSLAAIP